MFSLVTSEETSNQSPPKVADTTGQVALVGRTPRVTATLREDEGCVCFQVEAKGLCVARRAGMSARPRTDVRRSQELINSADNHTINGAKLFRVNEPEMTRDRRGRFLGVKKFDTL